MHLVELKAIKELQDKRVNKVIKASKDYKV